MSKNIFYGIVVCCIMSCFIEKNNFCSVKNNASKNSSSNLRTWFFGKPKLSSEFTVGSVKLSSELEVLLSQDGNVVTKMNQYFKKCSARQKEMFIEMLNETILPHEDVNALAGKVDMAIALTNKVDSDNWLKPKSSMYNSGSEVGVKSTDEQILKDLFEAALNGDVSSLEEIRKIAQERSRLSFNEQKDLIKALQIQTAGVLKKINGMVPEKNDIVHDQYPGDLDAQGLAFREIGQQQEANTRAVIKYCKDILRALAPICGDSQHLIGIVDRTTIDPVLNIIDTHDFALGTVKSDQELDSFLTKRIAELEKQGKIQVPTHEYTKPKFVQAVRDIVSDDYHNINEIANRAYRAINSPADQKAVAQHIEDLQKLAHNRWMHEQVQERLGSLIEQRGLSSKSQHEMRGI